MNKKNHLTLQDRQSIEQMLNEKKSFTEIAQAVGKHKSTISREVQAHAAYIHTGAVGMGYNACKNRYGCKKTKICNKCNSPQCTSFVAGATYAICTARTSKRKYVCVTQNRPTSATVADIEAFAHWRRGFTGVIMRMKSIVPC